jgi:hypothetical protein
LPELTPDELTTDLLALILDHPFIDSGEHPIWRWQRWIKEDPERAWQVFEQVVRQAPDEPDVLESVAYNLQILLQRRWADFSDRAVALVRSSPLLDVIVGPEVLTREHYGPRYRDLDELATVWVRQDSHSDASHRIDDIMRKDPTLGLELALEIIERGARHGFEPDALEGPFLQLIRHQGPAVIDQIEKAARESTAVRRVIWDIRRLNPSPRTPGGVPAEIWDRLMRASGGTTLYNAPSPQGARRSLGSELDELLDRWFISKECFWAWSEVYDLIHDDPAKGWLAVQALVRHSTSNETLGSIGAGALEDLIRLHPADIIEPIEELAREDERFRVALGCVWLRLEDLPENLVRRYWIASGRELGVLDAPTGWQAANGPSKLE